VIDRLSGLGIEYDDVIAVLESEGVDKFEKSWAELLDTVRDALEGADGDAPDDGQAQ
jgi:transaldolase